MIDFLRRLPIFRHAAAREFAKFGTVGVMNTAVDFLVYVALTRGWLGFRTHFLIGNFLAFFASVVNSYLFNKYWTFRNRDQRHRVQFAKFFLVNLVTLALYELILYLLVDQFHVFDLWAKAAAIVLVMVWNFSANKYWTFRR